MRLKSLTISLMLVTTLSTVISLASCATSVTTATVTQPVVTMTTTQPASTVTSTVSTTLPAVTVTTTAPANTVTSMTVMTTTSLVQLNYLPTGPITITGYLTTEDDFAANLGMDTAAMVHMRMMAASGLGITRQRADGKWEFYFFNGTISSGMPATGWTFNGTGAQLTAWNVVTTAAAGTGAMSPVHITVVGTLKGDTTTNPGPDADGLYFPVIAVNSITVIS